MVRVNVWEVRAGHLIQTAAVVVAAVAAADKLLTNDNRVRLISHLVLKHSKANTGEPDITKEILSVLKGVLCNNRE